MYLNNASLYFMKEKTEMFELEIQYCNTSNSESNAFVSPSLASRQIKLSLIFHQPGFSWIVWGFPFLSYLQPKSQTVPMSQFHLFLSPSSRPLKSASMVGTVPTERITSLPRTSLTWQIKTWVELNTFHEEMTWHFSIAVFCGLSSKYAELVYILGCWILFPTLPDQCLSKDDDP